MHNHICTYALHSSVSHYYVFPKSAIYGTFKGSQELSMEYERRYSTSSHPFEIPTLISQSTLTRLKRKLLLVYALVDSGASSSFMDRTYVQDNYPAFVRKLDPVAAVVASGIITHETKPITVQVREHSSSALTPVILGLSWLVQHNPRIDCRARRLSWIMNPRYLQCLESNGFRRDRTSPLVFRVGTVCTSVVEEVLGFKLEMGRCFLRLRLGSIVWEPVEGVEIWMDGHRPPTGTTEVFGKREFEVDAILGVRLEGGEYYFQVRLQSDSWEPAGNVKVEGKFLKRLGVMQFVLPRSSY